MSVSRSTVQAFYQAYGSLDPARVEPFLDDDVDWMISGPVDVLTYCGQRHGKRAVLEIFETLFPNTFNATSFAPQALLIDGDRAALLFVLSGISLDRARKISYRV